jgi:glutathione peroxidase
MAPRLPRASRWRARVGAFALLAVLAAAPAPAETPAAGPAGDAIAGENFVLDYRMNRIDGTPQDLADYRGQVLLLVNVASKCGLTPQYDGLEALYDRYRERGFSVLGFPANDFAGQEPGSDEQIAEFCRSTYGVRFPMFSKITVKGEGQHALYRELTSLPAPIGGEVQWNFQKYLVNRRGEVVAKFDPRTAPDDPTLVARLEALLVDPT